MHNLCKKIQDRRHVVQNEVSLKDMLKEKLFQANCMPNFPENKQMYNFLHIFFQHPIYLKTMGKKIFFSIFFFSGARVWGLWQNNAVSLSKHLTTHIDMILLFFAKNSQKFLKKFSGVIIYLNLCFIYLSSFLVIVSVSLL